MKEAMQALLEKLSVMVVSTKELHITESAGRGKEKVTTNQFVVTGFPASPVDLLIWLLKDQLAGGGRLVNFYSWFAGSAYSVKARSLNRKTKKVTTDGNTVEVTNENYKNNFPFADAFTVFVTPEKFKASKERQIEECQKAITAQEQMIAMLEQFATGAKLAEGKKIVEAKIASIQQEILQHQSDIAKLNGDSK